MKQIRMGGKMSKIVARRLLPNGEEKTWKGIDAVMIFVLLLFVTVGLYLGTTALVAWLVMVLIGALHFGYPGYWLTFVCVLLVRVGAAIVRGCIK